MEGYSRSILQSENIIEFQHSFGYDCKKYFNLCVADESTVLFASGNLIHFLNIDTEEIGFRRGANGGGIGHIAKNPVLPHVAVSETGRDSVITIYEWPGFKTIRTLKSWAPKPILYSLIVYSPNGKLVCQQEGSPEYVLKIWNWQESKIILQKISTLNEVANILFSSYIPGQFASSGVDHILFWKIARTFTGLKLVKIIGQFGMIDPTKIIGLLPLQDEKVVSGCQWGNILLWQQGHIKLEVLRKNAPVCHNAPITHFEYSNGELTSVGMDGKIKIWFFETIDEANPPEDNKLIQIEPIYEFQIGPKDNPVQLMSILKRRPENSRDAHWVAQDGNGGIWKLHLELGSEAVPSRQCLHCHAGAVMDMACSPRGSFLATIGLDGHIHIYDFIKKKLLLRRKFPAEGSCIIWLSKNVDPSGKLLLAGFRDGVIRMILVQSKKANHMMGLKNNQFITLIQVIKPHSQPITTITINAEENTIVSGSEDATIFVHLVLKDGDIRLVPVGFIRVPSAVTFLNWKPHEPKTIMVCCQFGEFVEMDLPIKIPSATAVSYEMLNIEKKSFELQHIKPASKPEAILFAMYTDKNTIWLSMAGAYAGYLYEYDFVKGLVSHTKIEDTENTEIRSYVYPANRSFLILGMGNGCIQVNCTDHSNFRNLQVCQLIAMHDQNKGVIRRLCFSSDQKYLFSCGDDGNIFSYLFNPNKVSSDDSELIEEATINGQARSSVKDIKDAHACSLEDMKLKIDHDLTMYEKALRISNIKKKLEQYKEAFSGIVHKNSELPLSQKVRSEEFEIDKRITEERNSLFRSDLAETAQKLAYTLEKSNIGLQKLNNYFLSMLDSVTITVDAISIDLKVPTYRQRKLPAEFYKENEMLRVKMQDTCDRDLKWSRIKSQEQERRFSIQPTEVVKKHPIPVDPFSIGVDVNVSEYKKNTKLHGIIDRYFVRRKKTQTRDEKLSEMMNIKPDPDENHPDDLAALEEAKHSVGEYQLKSAQSSDVTTTCRMTTLETHSQLMDAKEAIMKIKKCFNEKVHILRKKRTILIEALKETQMSGELHINKTNEESDLLNLQVDESPEQLKEVTPLKKNVQSIYEGPSMQSCVYKDEHEDSTDDGTEYEKEMEKVEKNRSRLSQDYFFRQTEQEINEFDNEARQLEELRVKTDVDIKLLEIFVLQISRKLIILKSFDQREEILLKDYYDQFYERYKTNERMLSLKVEIEKLNQEVRINEVYISELSTKFLLLTKESRFTNHLKQTYKKKYRPQDFDNDWPVTSSDESSSSDENSNSGKSPEVERRESKLEGFVSHEGFEKKLLQQAIGLRTERHQIEARVIEKTKKSECLKRENEKCQKKLEATDLSLQALKSTLVAFQNERQQELNNMEVIAVINAKQIDNIGGKKDLNTINDRLLFSQKTLNQIIARVSGLNKELLQQREMHKMYRKHLHRLKVECSQMKAKVTSRTREIADCKKKKFGIDFEVEDLELALLKSKMTDLQATVNEYKKEQDKKVTKLQNNLYAKQRQYCNVMKENTEKVNLLMTLQKDSNFLSLHLHLQAEKQKDASSMHHSQNLYIFDTKRLQNYKHKQLMQISALKKEVQILGNKTSKRVSLPPVLFKAHSQDMPTKEQESYLLGKYDEEDEYVRNVATDVSQENYIDPSIDTSVSDGDSVFSKDDFIATISIKGRSKSLEDGLNHIKSERND